MNENASSICHVSVPRSGHHMLVSFLSEVFEWGQFVHCENYDFDSCCHVMPCTKVSARANEAFGTDRDLRLFLQKSHDMFDELSVMSAERYIVQLRDPLQAAIGWLRWHQTPIQIADVMQASVGFLVYYLRFFHKWVANDRLSQKFVLRYEDLVAEPERKIDEFLSWAGVAFDKARMIEAVAGKSAVDAHTGLSRVPGASLYCSEQYMPLLGPLFCRLLPRLSKFCPGLPYIFAEQANRDLGADEVLDNLIFSVDLRISRSWRLDLDNSRSVVEHPSIRGRLGIPHSFGFGFAAPESSFGCWTDGDVSVVPLRLNAESRTLTVILEQRVVRGGPKFDLADVYLVIEGNRCECVADECEVGAEVFRRVLVFDVFSVESHANRILVEGCLVIRFLNLKMVRTLGEKRKLGILLAAIEIKAE